jgi:transcriptional regulator with XRE-family HTH domain
MEVMSISAEQIRSGRERLMMTQQQLADELGVSLRTVGNWERGETVPRNRLAPLAEVLRLTDEPLFGSEALLRRLGQLAKQRREEIGLGRQLFSKEAGLGSDRTVTQFEFGRTVPSMASQRKIEKALGWRLGVIDTILRQVNRMASEITMEDVDAEDSLYLESQELKSLALYTDDELMDELRRRLKTDRRVATGQRQDLYDLAASTNSEHLEAEDDDHDDEQADS